MRRAALAEHLLVLFSSMGGALTIFHCYHAALVIGITAIPYELITPRGMQVNLLWALQQYI